MATKDELATRLLGRFKGVPNYTIEDATHAVEDAMLTIGYGANDVVPDDKATQLLLLAQSESAFQIAFSVAHYFKFTDGEESVDKSMLSKNYRELAKDLRDRYDEEMDETTKGSSNFRNVTRIDRDRNYAGPFYQRDVTSNILLRPWSKR